MWYGDRSEGGWMSKRNTKYDGEKESEKIDRNIIKINLTLMYDKYE